MEGDPPPPAPDKEYRWAGVEFSVEDTELEYRLKLLGLASRQIKEEFKLPAEC